MATPYVTVLRNVVASTQDLAAAGVDESDRPVLVVAAAQTAGRGRRGNQWWQAERGVAASLAFTPDVMDVGETFSLALGLAVRSAIDDVLAVAVDLKWPNDLELGGLKVGGILVERNEDRVVVGCGLNLYWQSPPAGVAGLVDVDPGGGVGRSISELWARSILDTGAAWERAVYLAACSTVGAEVTWEPDGRGVAVSIDERGGLVVDTAAGRTTLRSGEVRTVRAI